jgi:hypothetical protein
LTGCITSTSWTGSLNGERVTSKKDFSDRTDLWQRGRFELAYIGQDDWFTLTAKGRIERSTDRSRANWSVPLVRLDLRKDSDELRLGYQTLSWGELLGPSAVDVVSPRDFRSPTGGLSMQEKLPQPMAIWNHKSGRLSWQLVATPEPKSMILPEAFRGVTVSVPDSSKLSPEYGGNASLFLGGTSVKAYVYEHANRFPLWRLAGTLQSDVQRQRTAALTADYAWDFFVLRSEAVHTSPVNDLTHAIRHITVAFDASFEAEDLIGFQLTRTQSESRRDDWFGAFARGKYFGRYVCPELSLYQNIKSRDLWQKLEVRSYLTDSLEGAISFEQFRYDDLTALSWVDDKSRYSMQLTWVL